MSRRGRPAVLPDQPHRGPDVLEPGSLLVRHRSVQGTTRSYDFASLPIAAAMRQSWATVFAARCTPGGGWNTLRASMANWRALTVFARFLAEQEHPPEDVGGLTVTLWNSWRLSRPVTVAGRTHYHRIAALLRRDPGLPEPVREAMAKRLPRVKKQETAYGPDDFQQIRVAAQRMFRAAYLRISENREQLLKWRSGAVEPGTRQWLIGEALDTLARTGHVPRYQGTDGRIRVTSRYVFALGGGRAEFTWRRLFLSRDEATALAVLLVIDHGLNATTVSEMPVPRATPDSGEDGGFPIYRIELEKRRRGSGRHFETRNLTDFGADSPGRLITQALEATAAARALVAERAPDLDRLLVWHETMPKVRAHPEEVWVGMFGAGLHNNAAQCWAQKQGMRGSPMRRLRLTVNVLHRREPGQNSEDTHDRVYVLPEPQAHQAAIPVIADGITDALEHARRTVLRAQLADTPGSGDLETATASCTDYKNSPFTPTGSGCGASFLLCTACPNARVTPAHHPRLAYLHRAVASLREVMDLGLWDADWADAHARLDDLRHRLGTEVWQDALTQVTAVDREHIEHLLKGHFDL
ncbi:hypothetical protein [Actinacidiphila oryziradicis]|uniref:Integrase n=1 Tax=Actinacidiphila oryziradicis TaxID=2571141 RepID=A0A4U0RJB8_9ACTN|nr:hypothetical protein [Actinacidiphila oryziradicis]TJZ95675.1 hypothetical protein FCI23_51925 [Actinacidiphila oryziradicis]